MKPLPPTLRIAGVPSQKVRTLDPIVRRCASEYAGSQYGVINSILRQGKSFSHPTNKDIHKALHDALIPTTQDLVLWRMTYLPKKLAMRKLWNDPAWVSTSMRRKGAEHFYNSYRRAVQGPDIRLNMRLLVAKGTPVIHMAALQYYQHTAHSHSELPPSAFALTEREILLCPGLRFRVIDRKIVGERTHEITVSVNKPKS